MTESGYRLALSCGHLQNLSFILYFAFNDEEAFSMYLSSLKGQLKSQGDTFLPAQMCRNRWPRSLVGQRGAEWDQRSLSKPTSQHPGSRKLTGHVPVVSLKAPSVNGLPSTKCLSGH